MAIEKLDVDLSNPGIKNLPALVRKDILSRTLEGNFSTFFKGKGIEFAGYRVYSYGDDASLIDWPASLRAKETLIRTFEIFKNFKVFIILDVSNSMLYTSQKKLKAEYGAELASAIAFGILKTGNAVGLTMVNDKLIKTVYPDFGTANLFHINKMLADPANYGGDFSWKEVVKRVLSIFPEPGLIIIISDFIGLDDGWEQYLLKLAEHNQVVGLMLRDPLDRELPKKGGQLMIKDPYSDDMIQIDTHQYSKIFREQVRKEEEYIHRSFEHAKAHLKLLSTDTDFYDQVLKFFIKGFHSKDDEKT